MINFTVTMTAILFKSFPDKAQASSTDRLKVEQGVHGNGIGFVVQFVHLPPVLGAPLRDDDGESWTDRRWSSQMLPSHLKCFQGSKHSHPATFLFIVLNATQVAQCYVTMTNT